MVESSGFRGEDSIARCRLILSVAAIVAVFIDPTEPLLARWVPLTSGRFTIDPYVLIVMSAHLAFSTLVVSSISYRWISIKSLASWSLWIDVAFAAAIGFMTEGVTSPFHPFFAFAVLVAGFRSGLQQAMLVTAVSLAFYLCFIASSGPVNLNLYIMRPAYLAITGYLVGYLGQQRIELQEELRQIESTQQRHRIARDLHDGFVQALAAINLRLEGCRLSLLNGDSDDVLAELADLRASVSREYDDLRAYMRTLAGIAASPSPTGSRLATQLSFGADFHGTIDLVDHVLMIAREALINIRRHASASCARIDIGVRDAVLHIDIVDDGVGLTTPCAPWSIASRVDELGGRIVVAGGDKPGAHLSILLPQG